MAPGKLCQKYTSECMHTPKSCITVGCSMATAVVLPLLRMQVRVAHTEAQAEFESLVLNWCKMVLAWLEPQDHKSASRDNR